jgi:hypothetical protein
MTEIDDIETALNAYYNAPDAYARFDAHETLKAHADGYVDRLLTRVRELEAEVARRDDSLDAMTARYHEAHRGMCEAQAEVARVTGERDDAIELLPLREDANDWLSLSHRIAPCDASEDLASWCRMFLRAHAAKAEVSR